MQCLVSQQCPTLRNPTGCSPPGFFVQGDSPGKNTGAGSLSLFQGNFLTQEFAGGGSPALQADSRILYQLSYQVSPVVCYPTANICFPKLFIVYDHTAAENF